MDEDGEEVAVESTSVHVDHGSHAMQFLYVPSTKGEGTAVFATNLSVGPKEAETFCRRYSRRWQIENEYKSIKNDFLAKTSSKDYRVRLFYFCIRGAAAQYLAAHRFSVEGWCQW